MGLGRHLDNESRYRTGREDSIMVQCSSAMPSQCREEECMFTYLEYQLMLQHHMHLLSSRASPLSVHSEESDAVERTGHSDVYEILSSGK